MKRVIILMFVMSCVLLLITPMAQAASITFNFTGNVTYVDSALSGTFSTGQSVSGSFTFDSTASNVSIDPSSGVYPGSLQTFNFQIGSYTGSMGAGTNEIMVWNDYILGVSNLDYISVDLYPPLSADVAGIPPYEAILQLFDYTHTAFNSISLPAAPPDLTKFDPALFSLSFGTAFGPTIDIVRAELTSLTVASAPVPEPSTLLLLGSGLLGLVGFGRRWMKK